MPGNPVIGVRQKPSAYKRDAIAAAMLRFHSDSTWFGKQTFIMARFFGYMFRKYGGCRGGGNPPGESWHRAFDRVPCFMRFVIRHTDPVRAVALRERMRGFTNGRRFVGKRRTLTRILQPPAIPLRPPRAAQRSAAIPAPAGRAPDAPPQAARIARPVPPGAAAGRHPPVSHFLKRLSQFVGSPGFFLATM